MKNQEVREISIHPESAGSAADGVADPPMIGEIELLSGPRAVEERLLHRLQELLAAARSDPSLLSRPVVVAVPSASLRAHLAARVVERAGGAVAGLSIVTLSGLARRIMQRAGEQPPAGTALMPLLVRNLARSEAILFERLDSLVDGYGAVEASVADLLDAGFEAVHAEALDERLADLPAKGTPSRVARAVVRLAGRVASALEEEGLGSRSYAFRRAAELLAEEPSRLVAREVFVHGFADATGCACDLIAALLRFHAARVLIDEPPDPSSGEPLEVFSSHFRERLESWGRVSRPALAPSESVASPPVVPCCVAAPGGEAEVRFAAARIAALLRDGVSPESIAVVARDIASYASPLRVHFPRLGVPFSGLAPVAAGGALARRLAALGTIVRQRGRCPTDRWLDGLAGVAGVPLSRVQREDLRLGLRHLGAARLEQLSEVADGPLVGPAGGVALPVRRGLGAGARSAVAPDADAEGAEAVEIPPGAGTGVAAPLAAPRRWLSGKRLSAACGAAARVLDRLALAVATDDSFESHGNRIRALALRDLAWRPDAPESQLLFKALDSLLNDLPTLEVSFDDFAHLLGKILLEAGAEPLGGAGGGVQVLSVMESRARTFTHLFVLGMNRDVFPRAIREDPLLSDSLRRSLSDMLPDIPIKQRGYDEERHLFAQLLASSDSVTLSWQSVGDNGKARAPSTLVERLRWAAPDLLVEIAPGLHSAAGLPVPTPAHEHALRWALYGERDSLGCAFEEALKERADNAAAAIAEQGGEPADAAPGAGAQGSPDTAPDAEGVGVAHVEPSGRASSVTSADVSALAAARLAVIREFDGSLGRGRLMGPYFGFVGRQIDARDPRFARPYVTALEQLARCPWKSFLERTLRIEPIPDPIQALPEVDARLIGGVVHRVLERMARDVLSRERDSAAARSRNAPPGKRESPRLPGESAGSAGSANNLADLVAAGESAVPLAWPGDVEVAELLRTEAVALLAEQGLVLAGLVEVLVAQAWPRLARARDLEWPAPDSQIAVAAVELEGSVRLAALSAGATPPVAGVDLKPDLTPDLQPDSEPDSEPDLKPDSTEGSDEVIYFRADRVDWVDGALVLTDYKTGRPLSDAVRPATRHKHFEAAVRRGEQLQAVAYAQAASALVGPGARATDAVGRYLYLTPDVEGAEPIDLGTLELLAPAADAELAAAFERAARALLAARREGSFAPRLVEPDGLREPALCGRCNVAEACLRGDSGARRRMAAWAEAGTEQGETPGERALRAIWDLGGAA